MSVKIEILDYKYGQIRGAEMLGASRDFTTSTNWTMNPAGSWTIAGGYATHGGNMNTYDYLQYTDVTFVQGLTYMINVHFKNVTQGNLYLANHLANNTNGFNNSWTGDNTITYVWVQGETNTDKLSIAASGNWDGDIDWIHVSPVTGIDWENSTVGSLDVTDHSDFPLAITFQVSDIRDITSTSGDYSKTFKIPATKNNNNILNHAYDAKIGTVETTIQRDCRILVNGFYSLVGSIKIKGIGLHGEKPDYYDCVFFGNNLGWAKDVDGRYMNQIEWGSAAEGLRYNKTTIMATWQHEDSDAAEAASAAPIVYPIVSYGDFNSDGIEKTIQLLDTKNDHYMRVGNNWGSASYMGFNDTGTVFGTFPRSDWRPAIFVKTTMDKIFSGMGYSISSAFMNTPMFKKLVWLLPNFKRDNQTSEYFHDQYSFDSDVLDPVTNVTNSLTPVTTENPVAIVSETGMFRFAEGGINEDDAGLFSTGANRWIVPLSTSLLNVTLENNSVLDGSSGDHYVTIGEYGYYSISLTGVQSRVARVYKGGSGNKSVSKITSVINIEVKSIGQTSWNIIASSECEHLPENVNGNTLVDSGRPSISQYIWQPNLQAGTEEPFDPLFLNKGDKIRMTYGCEITETDDSAQDFALWHFFKTGSGASFSINVNPKVVEYGQQYDLKNVINPEYKQVDFIKGVAHAFNLKMTTNQVTKTVHIEPFEDFYLPYGDAVDWTSKLDRSKQTQDKWAQRDIKQNIVFKYKSDDKDAQVKYRGSAYFNEIQDEYPYSEVLSNEFERGQSIFENPFFAGTYNAEDHDTQQTYSSSPAYSPCLWEVVSQAGSSRSDVPWGFEFQSRLLYWNKYSPTTNSPKKFVVCQTWTSEADTLYADDSVVIPTTSPMGAGWLGGIYPQATSIDRHSSSSPVLSYGNVWVNDYNASTDVYASSETGKGLYETYYKRMFAMLQSDPRIRTVYIDLKVEDIINLNFRKLIYIDGVYWRVNKIIDYFPNKNQPTKVELIQWIEAGVFAATAPTFGIGHGSPLSWGTSIYEYGNDRTNPNDDSETLVNGPG